MDDDKGLRQAFSSVFATEVKSGRADLTIVSFDKGMTNDHRNQLVAAGQNDLPAATGLSLTHIRTLPDQDYADLVDQEVAARIGGLDLRTGFQYPFSRKSEPSRRISLLTDSPDYDDRQRARLLRLATLRSVDSYFHKFRSNVRLAARPSISSGV